MRPPVLAGRLAAATAAACCLLAPPAASANAGGHSIRVAHLEAVAQTKPIGLDVAKPRLAWRLESRRRGATQIASRVRVLRGRKLVWDSGRVRGRDPWIDYDGRPLRSRTQYRWKVMVWDEAGRPSRWASATFETAFLDAQEWQARWIAGPPPPAECAEQRECLPAPLLRSRLNVDKPIARARLYASGMGYGTYFVNGRRVGDAVLDPGFTEYTERAFYVVHDVTALLRPGANAVGAMLGRGPFGQVGSNYAGYATAPWHADPRLRLELHVTYRDRSTKVLRSGPGWKTTDGPIRFDDYMLGETYDARRAASLQGWSEPGYDDSSWRPAPEVDGPEGVLAAQDVEPVRPQEEMPFRSVREIEPGTYLFDLGDNVAGNAILDADLDDGQKVTLHYGEKLDAAGHVDTSGGAFDGSVFQLDTYIGGPGHDRWRPEFTYKGFQYVEVAGLKSKPDPAMLRAQVWHTDWPATGSWESSNELIDKIVRVSRRSILSNTVSIPTDTPVYEKTGYTADGQLVAGAASYLFDTRRFYRKWLVDIRQSVAPNGDMYISAPLPSDPATTPPPFGFSFTSPGWDAALYVLPDLLHSFGGDARPGLAALREMARVRGYYDGQTRHDVIPGACVVLGVQECPNGLGDWAAPAGSSYGAALDSTAWWADMLRVEADLAREAGDDDTERVARARRAAILRGFDRSFWDPARGHYNDPLSPTPGELNKPAAPVAFSQHQNAIALGLDLVPEDRRRQTGDALAADVRARGDHLSTGIMGTRFLFAALTATGHVDDAVSVLTQTTYPSFGYWLEELKWPALGEYWEADSRSRNHQMYGSVVQWLYEDLAGFRPIAPGFARIEFRPEIPTRGVDRVGASTDTVRGRVATRWQRTRSGLELDVTVPPGATGEVHVPTRDAAAVTEGGRSAARARGVRLLGRRGDRVAYRVGSGTYRFVVSPRFR